jgi:hypothetical protein
MPKTITVGNLLTDNLPVNVSEKIYNDIWFTINQKIANLLVESGGHKFYINRYFGALAINRYKKKRRINKFGKPNTPVNWGKTLQYRREGKIAPDKFVYSNFNYGYKFVWHRFDGIKGSSPYKFMASRTNGQDSNSGLTNKLYNFLAQNDTNYLKFELK